MQRYGYHSYRGPIYNGSRIDPDGYGVGIELETDVTPAALSAATVVRGVRPERDGSLDHYDGVEFVFAATDDLSVLARRFTRVKERTNFRCNRDHYGVHVNINAARKSERWRVLVALSACDGTGDNRVEFLRSVGRRSGYSGPSYLRNAFRVYSPGRYSSSSASEAPRIGDIVAPRGRFFVSMHSNRVEFRIFKTCNAMPTLILYTLFSQYWAKWIFDVELNIDGSATLGDAIAATSPGEFVRWVGNQPGNDALVVHRLAETLLRRSASSPVFLNEEEYTAIAGEELYEICNRLSAPQRRSRRASPSTAVEQARRAAPSLSPA